MHSPLVDYHCHLDLYPNYKEVFADCRDQKIATLAVTTTPRAWEHNLILAGQDSCIRVGLGLHPQVVSERYREIQMFEQLLPKSRFVGEVGLDASPQHYASFQLQKDLFERILQMCAEQKNKILSIHAVRATREVLTLLEKHLLPNKGKAVLHWFSGTVAEAQRAAKLGCYFSINGEMLSKESRQNVVSSLPLTRILTETDGPFTKIDDQVTRPSSVSHTVSRLSRLIKMDEAILRELIATNLRQLES